jgi:hypothetical protein
MKKHDGFEELKQSQINEAIRILSRIFSPCGTVSTEADNVRIAAAQRRLKRVLAQNKELKELSDRNAMLAKDTIQRLSVYERDSPEKKELIRDLLKCLEERIVTEINRYKSLALEGKSEDWQEGCKAAISEFEKFVEWTFTTHRKL